MADGDLAVAILVGRIKQEHPDIFSLLNKPGIMDVAAQIMRAEDSGTPWTDAQITSALQATPYYQTTSTEQRSWDILQATDPATAHERGMTSARSVVDLEQQLGIQLTSDQTWNLSVQATINGWDPTRIRYEMLQLKDTATSGGDIAANAAQVKSLANSYGVPLSDNSTLTWAKQLASGIIDQDAVKGYLVEQAKSLFPALSGALDRGVTVQQYVDPYLQIAQQELGVNPAGVSLTDPKWSQILNQVDPKSGQRVTMSLDQALKTFRTDPSFGYDQTSQAANSATALATQLSQKFGASG